MRTVRLLCLVISMLALAPLAHADAKDIGVVLLHGKESMPGNKIMVGLANALRNAGYAVSTPQMAWSRVRMYDATVDEASRELDAEVTKLRQQGAQRIVVIGHSMGANAAIRYAVARTIDGVVALAPGHSPEALKPLVPDVVRARQLIADGKGAEKTSFNDINVGHKMTVNATPEVYLSWFDPNGDAVMPKNAAAIKSPVPFLCIVGSRDPVGRGQDYIFDKVPPHAKSKFLTIDADHIGVPEAGTAEVLSWLNAL